MDSHYCTDPAKFISVLCTCLATMLHVELPHVNLLSKMDLIEHYGKLGKRLPAVRRELPHCLPDFWPFILCTVPDATVDLELRATDGALKDLKQLVAQWLAGGSRSQLTALSHAPGLYSRSKVLP